MSDYICADNFKRNPNMKPDVKLADTNMVIFHIMKKCNTALRKYPNAYNEMRDRVHECGSFNEKVLPIIREYVNIID